MLLYRHAEAFASSGDVTVINTGDVSVTNAGDVAVINTGDVAVTNAGDVAVTNAGDVEVSNVGDVAVINTRDVALPKNTKVSVTVKLTVCCYAHFFVESCFFVGVGAGVREMHTNQQISIKGSTA